MKIVNRYTQLVLFENDADTMRQTVLDAIKSRANLSRANLSEADLSWTDLSWTDLSWTNLSRANLSRANLSRANLSGANLFGADLSGANLSWTDLFGADLSGANLSWTDLDFSSGFTLACKGSHFKCSKELIYQYFAHLSTLEIVDIDDELKAAMAAIFPEAQKSHRAKDLNLIEGDDE
jgi:hypothetical protein